MSYKLKQYIISHWRGEHMLARAFWINDAVLTAILLFAYVYFMGYVEYTFTDSLLIERVRLSLFVLAYFVLVPWQLYGLTHSCEAYQERHKGVTTLDSYSISTL